MMSYDICLTMRLGLQRPRIEETDQFLRESEFLFGKHETDESNTKKRTLLKMWN